MPFPRLARALGRLLPEVVGRTTRRLARAGFTAVHARTARELSPTDLAAPALVFAPHADDETLGCGGTILLKRRLGAPVAVVFMTDGKSSHAVDDPGALAETRRQEAVAACATLDVATNHLEWLGFPDGQLKQHFSAAVSAVTEVLTRRTPRQVFVPYPRCEHPDHTATRAVVLAALERCGLESEVFEYPIWFWRHWPWVGITGEDAHHVLDASVRAAFGARACRDLRHYVDVRGVLASKQLALACHASQLRPRHGLGAVSNGEFLERFFSGREWFRRGAR